MPRPGPRPYECVRRAWHSERHQPIRGSLIQEIFRMANEIHNPETQKNKEWQEKLPLVVLKAEEVMYSKANSESEYMDLKTLWERTNDAIDTIIRRDDSPETEGDLLQPCIEAALNLGCIPRRASRSQRHSNPGCYLSSTTSTRGEAASFLKIADINMFTKHLGTTSPVAFSVPTDPSSILLHHGFEPLKESTGPSLAHDVYPLYYSSEDQQPERLDSGVDFLHKFNFVCGNKSSSRNHPPPPPPRAVCDLSLRLGLSSPPLFDGESVWTHEVEDVASNSSCGGARANFETCFPYSKDKGYDFFALDTTDDQPLESCSSKWS